MDNSNITKYIASVSDTLKNVNLTWHLNLGNRDPQFIEFTFEWEHVYDDLNICYLEEGVFGISRRKSKQRVQAQVPRGTRGSEQ